MPIFPLSKFLARHRLRWALVATTFALWGSAWAAICLIEAPGTSALPSLKVQHPSQTASASKLQHAPPPYRLAQTTPYRHTAAIPPPLVWQLRDSDDLIDFIERARLQPASGGYYYALKAYDFCAREAKVSGRIPRPEDLLLDDPLPDLRRLSAALRIATLCRGFAQPQALPFSYISLTEEGQTLGDPKLALLQRLERLSTAYAQSEEFTDPVARSAMLNALLATRDPWLLRDLAAELRLIETKVTLVIDGEAIAPEEHEAFFVALNLAACELGAACSADDDWYQLLACSQAGECDAMGVAGSQDLLRATPPEQRIYGLQQRIRYRLLHPAGGWLDFVPREVP